VSLTADPGKDRFVGIHGGQSFAKKDLSIMSEVVEGHRGQYRENSPEMDLRSSVRA